MDYLLTPAEAANVIDRIRTRLADYCHEYHLTWLIVGLSGGLDSTLTAALAAGLPGVRVCGMILPCRSDPEHARLARLGVAPFPLDDLVERDLNGPYEAMVAALGAEDDSADPTQRLALGNTKARLRMITLYYEASRRRGMVLSTDNYSEYWMGFWTTCGDVGDYAPLQQVWKGLEEPVIAEAMGVPEEIITVPPTDGLGIAGTDEDQLGLPYPLLDRVIITLLQHGLNPDERPLPRDVSLPEVPGIPPAKVRSVWQRMWQTSYKRRGTVMVPRQELGLKSLAELRVLLWG